MTLLIATVREIFKKYPFIANSVVYGTLYVGAEFSQQYVTKRLLADEIQSKEPIDYPTIGRYAVMGTLVYAPTLYTWWLDPRYPGTTKSIIIKKLILDQFVLTPYLLVVFYTGMTLMENAEDPFLELREKFLPTFFRSCTFWLPAQSLNFAFVPPRFRVIYMGVCGFLWVNILCWIKRQRMQVVDNLSCNNDNNNNSSVGENSDDNSISSNSSSSSRSGGDDGGSNSIIVSGKRNKSLE